MSVPRLTGKRKSATHKFYKSLMAPLSPTAIAQLASDAGFSGQDLTTATAIALAESSGNPSAYNPETAAGAPTGQGSYGLFQIFLTAHPEYSASDLLDPSSNASAAYSVYSQAGGFSPWSTYISGAYQNFLSQAQAAVDSLGLGDSSDDDTQVLISPWVIGAAIGVGVLALVMIGE